MTYRPDTTTASPKQTAMSITQLFSYPFRIFFLSMALLATLVVPLWVLQVTAMIRLPLAMPGLFWHQHELLFGFLSAAIAGFLLTAVCVWTNTDRSHGMRLFLLWAVWLTGRLLLATGEGLPFWLVHGVNLLFLPLVMIDAGWRIWRARQLRQLLILLVLGLLWLMQLGFVVALDMRYSYGALIMAMALIAIVGGRITPAFTGGWLRQRGHNANTIRTYPALDLSSVIAMIILLAAVAGTQGTTTVDSSPLHSVGSGRTDSAGRHPHGGLAIQRLDSRRRHRGSGLPDTWRCSQGCTGPHRAATDPATRHGDSLRDDSPGSADPGGYNLRTDAMAHGHRPQFVALDPCLRNFSCPLCTYSRASQSRRKTRLTICYKMPYVKLLTPQTQPPVKKIQPTVNGFFVSNR